MVIFGVGLELNHSICAAGIYLCIAFYATSKLLIYAFLSASTAQLPCRLLNNAPIMLVEKVHVVWSPTAGVRRFKSRVYIICAVTVALYGVVIALMLVGKAAFSFLNIFELTTLRRSHPRTQARRPSMCDRTQAFIFNPTAVL